MTRFKGTPGAPESAEAMRLSNSPLPVKTASFRSHAANPVSVRSGAVHSSSMRDVSVFWTEPITSTSATYRIRYLKYFVA